MSDSHIDSLRPDIFPALQKLRLLYSEDSPDLDLSCLENLEELDLQDLSVNSVIPKVSGLSVDCTVSVATMVEKVAQLQHITDEIVSKLGVQNVCRLSCACVFQDSDMFDALNSTTQFVSLIPFVPVTHLQELHLRFFNDNDIMIEGLCRLSSVKRFTAKFVKCDTGCDRHLRCDSVQGWHYEKTQKGFSLSRV